MQGARLAGAADSVAVDLLASNRENATRFGATHAAAPGDVAAVKAEVTGERDGFDYGFEAIGQPDTIRATYDAVRRGGTALIVGVRHPEQQGVSNAYEFAYGAKTLRGTWFGSGDPRIEFPRLLTLWNAGRLALDAMISSRSRLADINSAFAELQAGRSTRIVLTA